MSCTIYDASVKVFIRQLMNLSTMLSIASSHPNASSILSDPLPPGTLGVAGQVRECTNTAKDLVARMQGKEPVDGGSEGKTYEQLQQCIQETLVILRDCGSQDFDGKEDAVFQLRGSEFSGRQYVLAGAVPSFYFHYCSAYGILKHRGVEISKYDLMGVKNDYKV